MKNTTKDIKKDKFNTVTSLELDLSLIDEDPDQPRTEFDPITLQELADTIRLRGVKTPISVHPNPESEGRFIINHGARRFRASLLAKKKTIPAFIDTDYSKVDQMIENLQRDALTPREIADFIGYQYSKGFKNTEVAKMIGKSPAYVSQHHTLLNLPSTIATIFNAGKVRDVVIINDLVRAFKESPEIVIDWVTDTKQEITRSSVNLLRQFIKTEERQKTEAKSDFLGARTAKSNKKASQYQYSNVELLSLLSQFHKSIDLRNDSSVKALDNLTQQERNNLSILLDKLVNFAK
ncbi:ParB/RepB/Spo0J family partition protein [Nitrosomonas sp. Nm84]|uniref:ParB/RepB/Spo0J family partition protein n=1 Tax=Nitrosomonas sp. Nm84 TaxID=200124 RepID=UPI000D77342D|nr:ParB/RepB/Spo0J family partition protein [Nitrosomonas sp. Nm84]PXW89094.1 ParB/RepB/Spo0J family partition protein [Nitrosomonas sp. Nm84]